MTRLVLILPTLLLAVACGESIDDKGSTLLYECTYTDTPLMADSEALGTTPADVAAEIGGTTEHAATWADGTETTATLDLVVDDAMAILREGGCGDYIALPTLVDLSTDDGGIDALSVEVDLEYTEGGSARAYASLDPSDVTGTWTPRALEPNESRRGLSLVIEWSAGGALTATLSDETEGTDGDVAWAASDPVLELDEGFPIQ